MKGLSYCMRNWDLMTCTTIISLPATHVHIPVNYIVHIHSSVHFLQGLAFYLLLAISYIHVVYSVYNIIVYSALVEEKLGAPYTCTLYIIWLPSLSWHHNFQLAVLWGCYSGHKYGYSPSNPCNKNQPATGHREIPAQEVYVTNNWPSQSHNNCPHNHSPY